MQPLHITDDAFEELTGTVRGLVDKMDQIPFPQIRDEVFDLLQGLDLMHREALGRLVQLLEQDAPTLLPTIEADPVLRTLMMLYDFMPAEAPPDPAPQGDGFVPLEDVSVLDVIRQPVWIPGGQQEDLAPGVLVRKPFEGVAVLLCRVGDDVFALQDACPGSILPLSSGGLEGHTVICPWHGCRFDVRTGRRTEGEGPDAATFPVVVNARGRYSVGFNISPSSDPL